MRARVVLSILLSVLAVVGPATVLYFLYGMGSTVDPESGKDLVALIATVLFSFSVGLGASALLKSIDKSFLMSLVEDILHGRESPALKGRSFSPPTKPESRSRQAA
jgi:hypothetical protein